LESSDWEKACQEIYGRAYHELFFLNFIFYFFQEADLTAWRKDGEQTCQEIYGRAYDKLRKRMSDMHPVLDAMMVCTKLN
jgi:hypothetical protein